MDSSKKAPVSFNLRSNSANEVQLTIRCDDRDTIDRFSQWLESEVAGVSTIARMEVETPITINHDSYFERLKKAA